MNNPGSYYYPIMDTWNSIREQKLALHKKMLLH
jgi:hypothetical protein